MYKILNLDLDVILTLYMNQLKPGTYKIYIPIKEAWGVAFILKDAEGEGDSCILVKWLAFTVRCFKGKTMCASYDSFSNYL